MHELYELKEKLLRELGDYSQNGKFSKEDAEVIKYLASSIDHICNIVMDMESEEGYSMAGGNRGGGRYSRDGYSRENRGRQGRGGQGGGQGGSYARRRDSRGRYTGYYRDGESIEELVENISEMMGDLPQELQREAQKFVQKLEQM